MRTTISIDDELLETATEYTGISEKSALVREALKRLVAHEAARRLARLGGSQPELRQVPRRRPPNFTNDESDYPATTRARGKALRRSAQ